MTRNPGLFAADLPDPEAVIDLDLLCGRFHYDTTAAAFFFDSLPHAIHVTPDMDSEQLPSVVRLIRAEAEERRIGASEVVTALTSVLFVIALRRHLDTPQIDRGVVALLSDKPLASSLLAMLTNPAEDWTVESLASLANMSRATFARRYSAAAGKGPAEILLAIRCLLALKMLRTTRLSIGEVANKVGYRSEAAFSKAFTRQMGITPSLARRAPTWLQAQRPSLRGPEPATRAAPEAATGHR
jgi:AraC family transcriptional activator of mtrCDE